MNHDHRAGGGLKTKHCRDEAFFATIDEGDRKTRFLDQYVLVLLPVLGCDGDDDFINGRMHELANGLLEYRHTTDLHQ